MNPMLTRRTALFAFATLTTALAGRAALAQEAAGQSIDAASARAFVKSTGDKLVAVVNGNEATAGKRAALTRIIDQAVDVNGVAKFCLGRFWRQATPAQQSQYITLFHQVLVTSISAKLGEYKGVTFKVTRTVPRDGAAVVETELDRPQNPPATVQWVIGDVDGSPRIVDVIAEGTSLRLTQRSDYASYLTRNNNSIAALIAAMKKQVEQNG